MAKGSIRFVVVIALSSFASGFQTSAREEAKALLREASELLLQTDLNHRDVDASNIAVGQIRAGDLDGALSTVRSLQTEKDRSRAAISSAGVLAERDLARGLQLAQEYCKGGDLAFAYLLISESLARKGDFNSALMTIRRISKSDEGFGRFFDGLLDIYQEQWKAGKKEEGEVTLKEALAFVDDYTEPKPVAPEKDFRALYGMGSGVRAWQAARHRPYLYNRILYAAISVGDETRDTTVVERIRELASNATKDEKEGILTELAIAEAHIGHFKDAERIAKQLHGELGSDDAWDEIPSERAIRNDIKGAISAFRQLSPHNEMGRANLARDLANRGQFDSARAVIDAIPSEAGRASALADLGNAEAEKQDPRARQTLDLAERLLPAAKVKQEKQDYGTYFNLESIPQTIAAARVALTDLPRSAEPDIRLRVQLLVYEGHKEEALALARNETDTERRLNALLSVANEILRLAH